MLDSIVFTFIGADRHGLVERISSVLVRHQANWLESRLARLSGQFSGMVQAQVAADRRLALESDLRQLAVEEGLLLSIVAGAGETEDQADQALQLEFIGPDRVGIVHEVAAALAALSVNIEELESESVDASWSGEQLFKARALVRVSAGTAYDQLRASLDRVADDLMLDIIIEPA